MSQDCALEVVVIRLPLWLPWYLLFETSRSTYVLIMYQVNTKCPALNTCEVRRFRPKAVKGTMNTYFLGAQSMCDMVNSNLEWKINLNRGLSRALNQTRRVPKSPAVLSRRLYMNYLTEQHHNNAYAQEVCLTIKRPQRTPEQIREAFRFPRS